MNLLEILQPIATAVNLFSDYIPIDGIPRTEIVAVSIPVAVTIILMEVCLLIVATVCLLFNFIYRNKK